MSSKSSSACRVLVGGASNQKDGSLNAHSPGCFATGGWWWTMNAKYKRAKPTSRWRMIRLLLARFGHRQQRVLHDANP